jgi:hypothetical protein
MYAWQRLQIPIAAASNQMKNLKRNSAAPFRERMIYNASLRWQYIASVTNQRWPTSMDVGTRKSPGHAMPIERRSRGLRKATSKIIIAHGREFEKHATSSD